MAEAAEQIENGELINARADVGDSIREAIASLQEADSDTERTDIEADSESDTTHVEDSSADAKNEVAEKVDLEDQDSTDSSDDQGTDGDSEEPEEVTLAPASWNKEDREAFAKADDDLKKVIARREGERDQYLRQVNGESAPLRAVADEFKDYFQKTGTTPDLSLRAFVAADQSLRFGTPQMKMEALQKIARDYGIDLAAPAAAPQQSDEEDYTDPGLARLEKVFSERLGSIEGQLSSRQQADDAAQERENMAVSKRFFDVLEAAKPEDMPEARYVEQVMPRFQSFVAEERSNGAMPSVDRLVELYRDAAYSTPAVREALASDRAARDEAARKAAEARTTRTVKTTSSSASGGSGVVAHSEDKDENLSVRDSVIRSIRTLEAGQ